MKKFDSTKKYTFNVFKWISDVATRFTHEGDTEEAVDMFCEMLEGLKNEHGKEVEVIGPEDGAVHNFSKELKLAVYPRWCEEEK